MGSPLLMSNVFSTVLTKIDYMSDKFPFGRTILCCEHCRIEVRLFTRETSVTVTLKEIDLFMVLCYSLRNKAINRDL